MLDKIEIPSLPFAVFGAVQVIGGLLILLATCLRGPQMEAIKSEGMLEDSPVKNPRTASELDVYAAVMSDEKL